VKPNETTVLSVLLHTPFSWATDSPALQLAVIVRSARAETARDGIKRIISRQGCSLPGQVISCLVPIASPVGTLKNAPMVYNVQPYAILGAWNLIPVVGPNLLGVPVDSEELAKLGGEAESYLRAALEDEPSAEVRHRAKAPGCYRGNAFRPLCHAPSGLLTPRRVFHTLTQSCARMRRYNMVVPQVGRPDDYEEDSLGGL